MLHVRIYAADWEESTSELYNSADLDPVVQSLQREIDVFKSKTTWRQLIKSDGRGNYRLNIE